MDNNTLMLVGIVVFAVVIVIGFFLYRGRASAEIKAGPVSGKFEGSGAMPAQKTSPAQPKSPAPTSAVAQGVKVGSVISSDGAALITNKSAGGVDIGQANLKSDLLIDNSEPTPGPPDPKALPPA